MAGWYSENGTSVSATERLRAALPRLRRSRSSAAAAAPEEKSGGSDQLREERVRLIADFIGGVPDDAEEPTRSNSEPPQRPRKRAG
jgi:hypothetical protein